MARLPWRRFCRRCGAEIATANLMDADPGVDREHFSLFLQGGQRRQLSPAEWRLFTAAVPAARADRSARGARDSDPKCPEQTARTYTAPSAQPGSISVFGGYARRARL